MLKAAATNGNGADNMDGDVNSTVKMNGEDVNNKDSPAEVVNNDITDSHVIGSTNDVGSTNDIGSTNDVGSTNGTSDIETNDQNSKDRLIAPSNHIESNSNSPPLEKQPNDISANSPLTDKKVLEDNKDVIVENNVNDEDKSLQNNESDKKSDESLIDGEEGATPNSTPSKKKKQKKKVVIDEEG